MAYLLQAFKMNKVHCAASLSKLNGKPSGDVDWDFAQTEPFRLVQDLAPQLFVPYAIWWDELEETYTRRFV